MGRERLPRVRELSHVEHERAQQLEEFVRDVSKFLESLPRQSVLKCEVLGGGASVRVALDSTLPPDGVHVIQIRAAGGGVVPPIGAAWEWIQAKRGAVGEIQLSPPASLTSGVRYTLTLLVIGGN